MEILLLHLFYHKRLIHIDDRFIHLINIPLKGDREILILVDESCMTRIP